jgi:hypothetical protein
MDLTVHRAYVKPVLIPGIKSHHADVATIWSDNCPIAELRGITEHIPVSKSSEWNGYPEEPDHHAGSENKSCGLVDHIINALRDREAVRVSEVKMLETAKMFVSKCLYERGDDQGITIG